MKLPSVESVNKRLWAAPSTRPSLRGSMSTLCEIARLAVLLLLSVCVRADDAIHTFGRGTSTSCGQFIAAIVAHKVMQQADGVPHVSERALIMEYVDGLLTGVNLSRDGDHQMMEDNAAVELWLQNWCAKHPGNNLLDAVSAFSAATPGRRPN
jgi:hypothetical protein